MKYEKNKKIFERSVWTIAAGVVTLFLGAPLAHEFIGPDASVNTGAAGALMIILGGAGAIFAAKTNPPTGSR